MRNILGKLFAIIAVLVLLFSAAFYTVSLILRDSDSIEKKFQELNVSADTGIGTPDLSKATTALLDYMRGTRANIKVYADVRNADGTVEKSVELFAPEKEKIHMAEVQELWLALEWFAQYGAMAAGVLLLFGFFLMQHGKRRALLSGAMFWGCGIFGGILAFMGVWAILDFDSFWTVFHFIIFPKSLFQYLSAGATLEAMNDLNWVLDADSKMIGILLPIFPSLVLRCAICVILEIAAVALVAVIIRFAWRKQGKPSPVADIVVIEHDENEPVPIKGPDLVLTHKLRNAPVRMRTEIVRRAYNGEPLDYDPVDHDTPEGSVDAPIDHEAEEPAGTGAEPTLQDDMPDGEMAPVGTGIARPEEGIDPDVPEADA